MSDSPICYTCKTIGHISRHCDLNLDIKTKPMTSTKKRHETEPTESNDEHVSVNKHKDSVQPQTDMEAVLNDNLTQQTFWKRIVTV